MQYHVAHLRYHFDAEWEQDLFEQQLFDFGFDTLDAEGDGIVAAYIQSELWTQGEPAIGDWIETQEQVEWLGCEAVPDANWNAVWEAEHPVEQLPDGVTIVPHCAFGAGHHETTGMMIEALRQQDLHGKSVLDMGCGTGVLAIYAAKRGATKVLAVDIDDKSVTNTEENAALNNVHIEARLGSQVPEGQYDLIMANIHRNILRAMLPDFAATLAPNGEVWMSGFLADDCEPLTKKAESLGLRLLRTHQAGEWFMLQFQRL